MATISKRKGAYQIIVSLGYDEAGKQIRKTTTYRIPEGTTPKKAEKLVKEYAMEFERKCKGMIDLDENMKYSELSELYFKNYAPNKLKEVTAYNYKKQSELHILPYLGSMKLKAITPTTITNMFAKMEVQPSTCKKIYTILQSVFSYALESRLIKESPCCAGVILPKQKYNAEQRKPFLSDSQAKDLLNMLDGAGYSEFAVIIKTLLYTGMRAGECLALQWNDLDFDNGIIHIRHNLADVGGKHWLDTPKTKNSIRTIGMSDTLKAILQNHREEQKEKIKNVGKTYKYPNMVFTSTTGDYKDRSRLNLQFKRFIKDTDFCNISLHKLRHANATLLINAGVDLKLVSENLGHSDVSVTANIYSEVLESSKKKMADLVALNLK